MLLTIVYVFLREKWIVKYYLTVCLFLRYSFRHFSVMCQILTVWYTIRGDLLTIHTLPGKAVTLRSCGLLRLCGDNHSALRGNSHRNAPGDIRPYPSGNILL